MADLAELIAQTRLLTSDVDPADEVFADADYERFLTIRGSDPRLAAATALRAMAGNINQVRGRVKMLDLSVDGVAQAKDLRDLAATYEREVDEAGTFDLAEPGDPDA